MNKFIYGATLFAIINPCFAMDDNEKSMTTHLRLAEAAMEISKNNPTEEEFIKAHQKALNSIPEDMNSAYYPTREIPSITLFSKKESDHNQNLLIIDEQLVREETPMGLHLKAAEKVREMAKEDATKEELRKAAQRALDLLPETELSAYTPELLRILEENGTIK